MCEKLKDTLRHCIIKEFEVLQKKEREGKLKKIYNPIDDTFTYDLKQIDILKIGTKSIRVFIRVDEGRFTPVYVNGNTLSNLMGFSLDEVADYFIDNLSFSDKDKLKSGKFTTDSRHFAKKVWMDYFTEKQL